LKRFLADRVEELHATWSELTHVIAELFANTRHKFADWQLRENIRRTREQAQVRLAQSIADVSHQAPKAGAAADEQKTSMQDRLRVVRNTALRIQNKAAAALTDSKQSARGLMNRRIRIRIAATSQLRTYVGRLQDAQTRSRNILRQNSRLATSLAMAALSALFTLGLIVTVGRYQPSANANVSGIAPTRQSAATVPATPVVPKPSPTRTANSEPAAKPATVVNTALRTQEKIAPPRTKTVRRPHHNEDEDYVAPDTYVYYGKKR
jgi:outer membrane receptor for ferric coprogen and ferric-rhodotorulic acid